MKKAKVAIVELSDMIRQGLVTLLEQGGYEVVCQITDLSMLESKLSTSYPDVVIIGSQMAGAVSSLRSSYEVLHDKTLLILVTTVCDDEVLRQADGVINVYDSASKLSKKLQSAIEQSLTNPYSDSHELSERECDVLVLVAKGMANKEIADKLNISIHTVMSHRKNIAHKTGIKSVAGLTVFALLNNLLDASEVNM